MKDYLTHFIPDLNADNAGRAAAVSRELRHKENENKQKTKAKQKGIDCLT